VVSLIDNLALVKFDIGLIILRSIFRVCEGLQLRLHPEAWQPWPNSAKIVLIPNSNEIQLIV
jgi:hypothetical protein